MKKLMGFGGVVTTTWVVLALGGPGALLPFKAAAQAATEVSVAFVVDFSGALGVQTACVKVPSTDDEYQALAAFTQQEHESAPTYNGSGLLCSIAGVPTGGCGQPDGRGYIYWAYWHGDSGAWAYSDAGASGTVHTCDPAGADCDVEGWKFEDPGAGNPTDPPPQSPPDYDAICPSTTGATTTSVPSPSTTVASSSTSVGSAASTDVGAPTAVRPSGSPSSASSGESSSAGPGTASSPVVTPAASPSPASDQVLAHTGLGPGMWWLAAAGGGAAAFGGLLLVEDQRRRRASGRRPQGGST